MATNVEQYLDSVTIWHMRLGYINGKSVNMLAKHGVFGNKSL